MRLSFFRALVIGLLTATMAVPAGDLQAMAQQQQQQQKQDPQQEYALRVEVPLVTLDVVVTDNRGSFVGGLQKENFRVLEDGVPQRITNFAPTDAPITIVLLMEFSKLAFEYFAYQGRQWAYHFLNYLGKDDWVALVSYDLKTRIEVDFTRNKAAVQDYLARMYFPGFTEANLYDAVVETVDRLADVKGKKSILIVASGFDTFSKINLGDALNRLKQTDVTIFSIGVGRDFIEYFDDRGMLTGPQRTDYYQAQNQLSAFAQMTGGRAWFPRFQGQLPSISEEVALMLRNQYSVGYVPANQKRDGKFRKLKVELVDKDGKPLIIPDQKGKPMKLVVYHREGYAPPKGGVGD